MVKRILIVEDEAKIARVLSLELAHEGYESEIAETGRTGLEMALNQHWDLILLDIMLPELNGIEVLRRFRSADKITPVILLTARNTIPDKVGGLDHGANDYITKPFHIEELLARIRSCMRLQAALENVEYKVTNNFDQILAISDLSLNLSTREVKRGDQIIELTPREFNLLVYLIKNKNQVLNREQIMNVVWGYDFYGDTNVVDVYIRYLRKKIDYSFDKQLIHTVRGVGYSIKET